MSSKLPMGRMYPRCFSIPCNKILDNIMGSMTLRVDNPIWTDIAEEVIVRLQLTFQHILLQKVHPLQQLWVDIQMWEVGQRVDLINLP
jgi:hypothetical protein